MKQMVKGFCEDIQDRFDKQLGSIKWNIWHGNVEKALDRIESFCDDIEYDEKDKQSRGLKPNGTKSCAKHQCSRISAHLATATFLV